MSDRRRLEYKQVQSESRQAKGRDRYKRLKPVRSKHRGRLCLWAALLLSGVALFLGFGGTLQTAGNGQVYEEVVQKLARVWKGAGAENILKELEELGANNREAADFVTGYSERDSYIGLPIDLSGDLETGTVPLLMQWDKRWGYDAYGESIIGLSGCGPVCLTMAYLFFTEDITVNPRTVAAFAADKGYYTSEGTSWSFWTEGVKEFGLEGEELPLDENRMKQVLDRGGLIVCSMRPGDFTTTGHFILIRGYGESGFIVNDPNRSSNSQKNWPYNELSHQIKNLWSLTAQEGT